MSPAAHRERGCARACSISARERDLLDLRRSRRHLRTARSRRLRGLLRPVRRHRRDAGELSRHCSRPCARARCSWSAPIPTSSSSAATTLVYCAGALADAYAALGGEVLYCGKPYAPIYRGGARQSRRRCAAARCRANRVLAIGDSVRTDLKGAAVVRRRLPVRHLRACTPRNPAAATRRISSGLNAMFAAAGVVPKAVTRRLAVVKRWRSLGQRP